MLPFGANLNVYYNRFVSSDGLIEDSTLRGDEDPIGFLQNHFNPYTGEIVPSEETDDILKDLGEKYCTSDLGNNPLSQTPGAVRKGSAVRNYQAGPTATFWVTEQNNQPNPNSCWHRPRVFKISFVDSPKDGETNSFTPDLEHPRGYYPYLAGYRWNHHFYCTGVTDGN